MERPLHVVVPGKATIDPPFPKIGIVGLDAIGCSIGLAARRLWPSAMVIGVDRNQALEPAVTRHAIDVGADDLGMLAGADLVVLATPTDKTIQVIADLPDAVEGEAVVTDLGATKRAVVAAAAQWPARLTFVGGHPLTGLGAPGCELAHASHDLFTGRPWALTPDATTPAGALDRLERFIRALRALPVLMSADEHDVLMESGLSGEDLEARLLGGRPSRRSAGPGP